jgi:hypothetical protein
LAPPKAVLPTGGDQLGRIVKVTPHGQRRTQIQSWRSSCICFPPLAMTDDCLFAATGQRRGSSQRECFTRIELCLVVLAVREYPLDQAAFDAAW